MDAMRPHDEAESDERNETAWLAARSATGHTTHRTYRLCHKGLQGLGSVKQYRRVVLTCKDLPVIPPMYPKNRYSAFVQSHTQRTSFQRSSSSFSLPQFSSPSFSANAVTVNRRRSLVVDTEFVWRFGSGSTASARQQVCGE